jgi:Tol biopolymer transport system component
MRISNRNPLARAALSLLMVATASVTAFGQASFAPFYGKNKVKYDKLNWRVYRSPHFEVYYYPEFEQELGRLVSYAESAYEKVSNDLKHEISFPIPLILYKTFTEFAQTNLFPSEVPEGVGAFAEPTRDRMVIPIDNPPDELQELFIHELTHIFQFDIIPRSLVRRSVPVWIDEGMATYEEGRWAPLDSMVVRDAAVTDQLPSFEALDVGFARAAYSFGASIFDFIEERFGKEGVRQFVFALRRAVVGGVGEEVYQQTFRMTPEEFHREWKRWLTEKYKPFRDKEIPDDYSQDMSPNPNRGNFVAALSAAPSPSKEIVAVMSVNRKEGEFDIILISAKDGKIIKNLTPGYTGAFEDIVGLVGEDSLIGRNLCWTPDGNNVVFFGKYKKRRALIMVNVLESKVVKRIEVPVDRALFPQIDPKGEWAYFTALKDGISDVWRVNLATEEFQNVTQDAFYDKYPAVSPDGKWLYYSRRISGHDKLYRLDLGDPERKKEQMTFGTFDDASPTFSDNGKLLFYTSNEDDDIYNIRSLDLETGDVIQYTDVLGGNFSPSIIRDVKGKGDDVLLFTSYYKGNWGLYRLPMNEPVKEITADMIVRTEGPVIDFVPPVSHQIISENKRKKNRFEKFYIDGAPPIAVGVTSGGDFFGGSGISFSDVLGDQNFTFLALSVREFRQYYGSYTNRSGRFQYALAGFDTTNFFYATPYSFSPIETRQDSLGTIRQSGATLTSVYPVSKFSRFELGAGLVRQRTRFEDPFLDPNTNPTCIGLPSQLDCQQYQSVLAQRYPNGTVLPLEGAFVQETTRYRNYGPIAGSTSYLGFTLSPGGPFLSRRTLNVDTRKYFQLTSASLFAVRFRGIFSKGENPDIFWFGGNGDMRGYEYLSFVGNTGFFANAELRFPIIDAAITPIGFFGPLRGLFFIDMGGAYYNGQPFTMFTSERRFSSLGNRCGPGKNSPCISDGWGLGGIDPVTGGRGPVASYGIGLTFNFFGLPMNINWSRLTDFATRAPGWKTDFWIGYTF